MDYHPFTLLVILKSTVTIWMELFYWMSYHIHSVWLLSKDRVWISEAHVFMPLDPTWSRLRPPDLHFYISIKTGISEFDVWYSVSDLSSMSNAEQDWLHTRRQCPSWPCCTCYLFHVRHGSCVLTSPMKWDKRRPQVAKRPAVTFDVILCIKSHQLPLTWLRRIASWKWN